jgi:hypothetical protein
LDTKDLSEYVKSVVEGVTSGTPNGFELKGNIRFDVSVVKVKEAGGNLRIMVVDLGGKVAQQNVSRICFEVGRPLKLPEGYSAIGP